MQILVAAQDSAIVEGAARFLKQHSWSEPVALQIVHVVEPLRHGYHADVDSIRSNVEAAQTMVDMIVKDFKRAIPGAKVQGIVVEGDPKEEIVRFAQQLPAELIIMGSHGRGLIGRIFLGSVSLAVHASAPCSVLILREFQKQKKPEK